MSDLIKRQDAIDAIANVDMQVYEGDAAVGRRLYLTQEEMLAIIENLPSVEPKRKWIPITERLPEEREWLGTKQLGTTKSDEVYVTFENPKGERFCKHLSFQNGKLSRFDQSTIDAFYPEAKPIAWMPLPEPYVEKNHD